MNYAFLSGLLRPAGGGLPPSSVVARYDLREPSSYTLVGSNIDSIIDLSGNGRNMTQTTDALRPALTSIAPGTNNAGQHTSANKYWETTDATILDRGNSITANFDIFWRWNQDFGSALAEFYAAWGDFAGSNYFTISKSSTRRLQISRRAAGGTARQWQSSSTVLLSTVNEVLVEVRAGTLQAYLNGTLEISGIDFTADGVAATSQFRIGWGSSSGAPFRGKSQALTIEDV